MEEVSEALEDIKCKFQLTVMDVKVILLTLKCYDKNEVLFFSNSDEYAICLEVTQTAS
jgi:hypothetical protein